VKYDVLIYGNPLLRRKAEPVDRVDEEIRQLAGDMLATMYESNGIGLAAQQIGRTEAICVIDIPADQEEEGGPLSANPDVPMPLVMVNPGILSVSGEQESQEGCLSFPEITVKIRRAANVTIEYTSLENGREKISATGLLARAIQHEVDHLNGVLLADRMSAVQKVAIAGKLKRLKNSA